MPTHLIALDVDYKQNRAQAAALAFNDWPDTTPTTHALVQLDHIAPYIPGQFYRRELPCLLKALEALQQKNIHPKIILIDAYVTLANNAPGLGAHLYDHLQKKIPIIGIAKNPFQNAPAIPILRGASQSPLHITALGIDPTLAATHIQSMPGPHRLATMIQQTDHLARTWEPTRKV